MGSCSHWVSMSKGEGEGEASSACEEKLCSGRKRKEALVETLHFLTSVIWGFLPTSPLCFPSGVWWGDIAASCCRGLG